MRENELEAEALIVLNLVNLFSDRSRISTRRTRTLELLTFNVQPATQPSQQCHSTRKERYTELSGHVGAESLPNSGKGGAANPHW